MGLSSVMKYAACALHALALRACPMHGSLGGGAVEPPPPGASAIGPIGQPLPSNPSGPEYLSVPHTPGIRAIFCELALQVEGTGFALQCSAGVGLG